MKVLFASYNTCCQNASGGVQVRIRKVHNLLRNQGVEVDFFKPFETNLRDYDVLHVFGLNIESRALVSCAKSLGLKVILSSIVNIGKGRGVAIDIYRKIRKLPIATTYNLLFDVLDTTDMIICETYQEREFIHNHYRIDYGKMLVIPNGYDEMSYAGDEIYNLLGSQKKYILQVGRFDENKNQLNVIKAVKNTAINMVFIGAEDHSDKSGYFSQCKEEAKGCDNIFFLGWLKSNSDELRSAYQNATALVLPSYQETFGLVAVEAASYGCRVCLSNTLPILDFEVFDRKFTFDPTKVEEIKTVLSSAYAGGKDYKTTEKIVKVFSWDKIINQHIECYQNRV